MGCFLDKPQKFYNKVFLFVGLKTLGTSVILFYWLIKLSVRPFQSIILIYIRVNLL